MIREYRGWSLTREEWAYGFLGLDEEGSFYITDGQDFWHALDPKSIGQHSGLSDVNGVKIYEGDIVSYTQWPRGIVTWSNVRCCYYIEAINGNEDTSDDLEMHEDEIQDSDVRIIGNVYNSGLIR